MSSHIRRLQWNSRERLITDDFNNSSALHHRALIEAALALGVGDGSHSGVIRGLDISVAGGSFNVVVNPGLALILDSAATTYDSDYQWIELREAEVVDLTAYVSGAGPRWVLIAIEAAAAAEVTESRDIFNPALGTFTTSSVTKVTGSSPTLTVVAGTAAAAPIMPAPTATQLPLGYVYIDQSAANLTAGDSVGCRPLLRLGRPDFHADGGGFNAAGDSLVVEPLDFYAELGDGGPPIGWTQMPNIDLDDTGDTNYFVDADGVPITGTGDAITLFAVRPPYAAGGPASMAPREMVPGSNAVARIPSLADDALQNCLLIATTTAQPGSSVIRGNSIDGQELNDGTWGGEIPAQGSVYVGSVSKLDGFDELIGQIYCGAGMVHFTTDVGAAGSITETRNSAGTGTGDWRRVNLLSSTGDTLIPNAASGALVQVSTGWSANQDNYYSLSHGAAGGGGEAIRREVAAAAGVNVNFVDTVMLNADGSTGDFRWEYGAGTVQAVFSVHGYRDGILSKR